MRDEFRALLQETKIITYKSQKMIAENEQHLKDILAVLEASSGTFRAHS